MPDRAADAKSIVRTVPPLAPEVIKIDDEAAGTATDLDGRGLVAWRAAGKQMIRWLAPLTSGTTTGPLEVPETIDGACFTADRAWLQTPQGLIMFSDGKLARSVYADPLVGCTAEAALTRNDDEVGESYELCTESCRKVTRPGAPRDASVTTLDGKLVAVAAHDGVLGVWREQASPRFFALPEARPPDPRRQVAGARAHRRQGHRRPRAPRRRLRDHPHPGSLEFFASARVSSRLSSIEQ